MIDEVTTSRINLSPELENENINGSFPRLVIEPTTVAAYSHTLPLRHNDLPYICRTLISFMGPHKVISDVQSMNKYMVS